MLHLNSLNTCNPDGHQDESTHQVLGSLSRTKKGTPKQSPPMEIPNFMVKSPVK